MIKHIRRWNLWRHYCMNGWMHKILVLFKVIKSPTFNATLLPEEWDAIEKAFLDAFKYVADETKMGKENNEQT